MYELYMLIVLIDSDVGGESFLLIDTITLLFVLLDGIVRVRLNISSSNKRFVCKLISVENYFLIV
jgi:hypothetical protein